MKSLVQYLSIVIKDSKPLKAKTTEKSITFWGIIYWIKLIQDKALKSFYYDWLDYIICSYLIEIIII